MEFLTDTDLISCWLLKYGSVLLFFMLSLGIIALPVPEETLMVAAGVLMHKGKLDVPATIFFSYAGTICGISVSYLLGRSAGNYLIKKYGSWIGITEQSLQKAHYWFERFGKWLIFIGYFIPGVRHFTGFSAGMTKMEYPHFALFAYTGAIVWVSLFLALGYFLGQYWGLIFEKLEGLDIIIFTIGIIIILGFVYVIKKRKNRF